MHRQALLLSGLLLQLGSAACLRAGWDQRLPETSDPSSDLHSSDAQPSDGGTFSLPTVLANVNDPANDDWAPTLSPDGLELFFASWRPGGKGEGDIWRATRSSPAADFSAPAPVSELNSASFEGTPWLAADGRTLVFVSEREQVEHRQLYLAVRASVTAAFSMPTKLHEIATAAQDEDLGPVLVEDGRRLYFSSTRPGGKGGHDIWMSTRASTSEPFDAPTNLTALNSSADDLVHAVSPDGKELYFSSDRSGGVGKLDLYVVALSAPGVAGGTPVNLRTLNTAGDDVCASLAPDGLQLLFNRNATFFGGAGLGAEDADIWISRRSRVP